MVLLSTSTTKVVLRLSSSSSSSTLFLMSIEEIKGYSYERGLLPSTFVSSGKSKMSEKIRFRERSSDGTHDIFARPFGRSFIWRTQLLWGRELSSRNSRPLVYYTVR